MPSSAREGYIGLAKQAAKGTGVAPTKFVKWTGNTDMSPKQAITIYREGGDSYDPGALALKENHKPDGSFSMLARPDLAGFLYALALGVDVVSGTGPYTHTITPGTPAWVSIERQIGGMQERYIDCRIKTLTLEGEAGKPLKLSVEFVGINQDASVTVATATYETDMPFVFYQGTYTWDGALSANVEKFKLTYANAFDEDFLTSAVTRQDIPFLSRDVDFEATISMEDSMVFYKKVYLGAGTAPGTSAPTGAFVIDQTYGAAAAQRGLNINVPRLAYSEAPVELNSDDERLRYEIKAKGSKAAGSALITIVAKTGTTPAYV